MTLVISTSGAARPLFKSATTSLLVKTTDIVGRITQPPSIVGTITQPPSLTGTITQPPNLTGRITQPPGLTGTITQPPSLTGRINGMVQGPELKIAQGEILRYPLLVEDAAGAALDLTLAPTTVFFALKKNAGDTANLLLLSSPATGIIFDSNFAGDGTDGRVLVIITVAQSLLLKAEKIFYAAWTDQTGEEKNEIIEVSPFLVKPRGAIIP